MRSLSLKAFVVLGLALAVGVSPYASSSPDGLEKVAEKKGFLEDGRLHSLQEDAPIPDYAFPGIDNPRLATAAAGFVGTLLVAAIGAGIAWLVRRRRAEPHPSTA
jgi:PDGLE domain